MAQDQIIKLAILAVGGQGGGVLTNWIVDLAEQNGWVAQSTAVAGVAQRTGATIYYVEMAPQQAKRPIFSLAPSVGDVDILIAAELMEVGRAIQRGFVSPNRTCLIGSSHRLHAVSEKINPGDGRAQDQVIFDAAHKSAQKVLLYNYDRLAVQNGSYISASLFGALAASSALPFDASQFEAVLEGSGRGAQRSVAAFKAALAAAPQTAPEQPLPKAPIKNVRGPQKLQTKWQAIEQRIEQLPQSAQDMALAGANKCVEFQNVDYAAAYLDTLEHFAKNIPADRQDLITELAKHLANAMAYDDLIRVADLKTRQQRLTRIENEVQFDPADGLTITEYFHPRAEEICGLMPPRLGRWFEDHPKRFAWLDRRVNKGRRIRSNGFLGFSSLYLLGGLKWWRKHTLRDQIERNHREAWLEEIERHLNDNPDFALELIKCRRLIKGYSDTHHRSLSKFSRIFDNLHLINRLPDAADWLRRWRDAALMDENGDALDGAIKTVGITLKQEIQQK
jgi:indolepyruvate ferredoxin oxidoreductase beta subunit